MTHKIQEKLHHLKDYDVSEEEKIQFIDQLYQFNYHIYDMYMRNWQNEIEKYININL